MGMEVMKSPGTVERVVEPEVVEKQTRQQKLMTVGLQVHEQWDVIRVNDIEAYYYKEQQADIYQLLDDHTLSNWVRNGWLQIYGGITPKDLTDGISMVKILTKNEVDTLSDKCIMVSEHLFWDKEEGELFDHPTAPVFYRLFDTEYETKHLVKVDPFTAEQEVLFRERYEQVKSELEEGVEIERYEPLKVWADGSHDVYMDLHRAHAYMFLQKKPLGAYILIGLRRNGKSTYIDFTKTIVGERNASSVQLSQLGDPHYTHTLRSTLMNAPDEEDDKAVNAQAFFKTMTDHGVISLPVMRSNVPVRLVCDFMCFFPMNHTPEWKGSGAAACMNRSLIIPFNADLSKYDKTSSNFAKETFTSDFMADYLGSVFAYAYYYHRHDLEFSRTMHREQEVLEQDLDSCVSYLKAFERYFDGYENFKTLYTDYQYWCQAQDLKINSRKELKFVFRVYTNSRISYTYLGTNYKVNRIPKVNHRPLLNDLYCEEVGKLPDLHDRLCSMVDRLDVYYEGKEMQWD